MKRLRKTARELAHNPIFCLSWLLIGAGYITWFGFLKNPLYHTHSKIAMDNMELFYVWVLFTAMALHLNVGYMYRRHKYEGKAGRRLLNISFLFLLITAVVPYAEGGLQKKIHWGAALSFGFLSAAAIVLFLVHRSKSNKRYAITLGILVGVLVLMLLLLKLFAENGLIETVPMLAAYTVLFLVNYTDFYHRPAMRQPSSAKHIIEHQS